MTGDIATFKNGHATSGCPDDQGPLYGFGYHIYNMSLSSHVIIKFDVSMLQ